MSGPEADAGRIRRLLLGELPEDERDALEGRLLAEEGLFALAGAVEEELADAYAAGTLGGAERRSFEARLALVPGLRETVRAAERLDRAAARLLPRPEPAWRRLAASLRAPGPSWQWSLATTLAVALAVGTTMHLQVRGLREQAGALQAERDAARGEALRLADEAAARAAGDPPVFALAPGVTRAGQGATRIRVGHAPDRVVFHLDLEAPAPGHVRAVLEASSGAQVFVRDGLAARDADGYRFVEVSIPAGVLDPGAYLFRLEASHEGRRAPAGTYVFEVTGNGGR
jgi:hypothetical protein